MIDPINDKLIPFGKLPSWCEKNLGHRISPSTLHRWRFRGIRGVKLETILIGGKRFTGESQLLFFFAASTRAQDGKTYAPLPEGDIASVSGKGVSESHSEAAAFLETEGI